METIQHGQVVKAIFFDGQNHDCGCGSGSVLVGVTLLVCMHTFQLASLGMMDLKLYAVKHPFHV